MTDRLAVEANGARLDEHRFPGRQGRILFAYLAAGSLVTRLLVLGVMAMFGI